MTEVHLQLDTVNSTNAALQPQSHHPATCQVFEEFFGAGMLNDRYQLGAILGVAELVVSKTFTASDVFALCLL